MKKLSEVDTATVSEPTFMPNLIPGPNVSSGISSAMDYFLLFFDEDIIDMVCVNSNFYAELYKDKYKYSYKYYQEGLNRINFMLFLAIVVYMGFHPREDYFSYWSNDPLFSSEFIQGIPLSRNVFSSLLTILDVSDIDPCSIDPTDCLHKVRFLLNRMKENCMKLYQPRQHISMDERMVKSKGRFICKQYVRMKPTKWGFKLWVLCDSANGYTWNFSVY